MTGGRGRREGEGEGEGEGDERARATNQAEIDFLFLRRLGTFLTSDSSKLICEKGTFQKGHYPGAMPRLLR